MQRRPSARYRAQKDFGTLMNPIQADCFIHRGRLQPEPAEGGLRLAMLSWKGAALLVRGLQKRQQVVSHHHGFTPHVKNMTPVISQREDTGSALPSWCHRSDWKEPGTPPAKTLSKSSQSLSAERKWVLLKRPRRDIDGVGEGKWP